MAGNDRSWPRRAAPASLAALIALCLIAPCLIAGCAVDRQLPAGSEVPAVTLVWPLDGDDAVRPDTDAAVHFNVPMDRESVAAALRVTPRVGCEPVWRDDTVLNIVPSPAWPEGARVTVEVGRGAKSATGVPIGKSYRWSFTIARQYLAVASTSPSDGAIGVPLDSSITIIFDRAVDPATVDGNVRVAPNVPGALSLLDDKTLLYDPQRDWEASSTYRLTLEGGPRGIKALDGHELEADYVFTFSTVLQTVIAEVDVDSGDTRTILSLGDKAVGAIWSPDGTRIALAIQAEVPEVEVWGFFGSLWVYDRVAGTLDKVGEGSLWTESNDLNNTWSPDGVRLLYSDVWHPERPAGIWRAAVGGAPELIISSQSDDMIKCANPVWSPNGSRIAYRLYGDWMSHVYVAGADGTGHHEIARYPIKVSEYSFRGLHWSPDGRYVSVEEEDEAAGGGLAVFLLDPEGRVAPRRLCAGWRHSWSPDGSLLALVDDAIKIIDVATGRAAVIARPKGVVRWGPCWSPDGLYVAYEVAPDPESAAEGFWVAKTDGSGARQVTTLSTWGAKSWAPDGHRLLFVTADSEE